MPGLVLDAGNVLNNPVAPFGSGNHASGVVLVEGNFNELVWDQLLTNGNSTTDLTNITFAIAPVPIPAAVWLFGSALGLVGWMRRNAA